MVSSYKTAEGQTVYVVKTPTGSVSGTQSEFSSPKTVSGSSGYSYTGQQTTTPISTSPSTTIPSTPTPPATIKPTINKNDSYAKQVNDYLAQQAGTYGQVGVPSTKLVTALNAAQNQRRYFFTDTGKEADLSGQQRAALQLSSYFEKGKGNYGEIGKAQIGNYYGSLDLVTPKVAGLGRDVSQSTAPARLEPAATGETTQGIDFNRLNTIFDQGRQRQKELSSGVTQIASKTIIAFTEKRANPIKELGSGIYTGALGLGALGLGLVTNPFQTVKTVGTGIGSIITHPLTFAENEATKFIINPSGYIGEAIPAALVGEGASKALSVGYSKIITSGSKSVFVPAEEIISKDVLEGFMKGEAKFVTKRSEGVSATSTKDILENFNLGTKFKKAIGEEGTPGGFTATGKPFRAGEIKQEATRSTDVAGQYIAPSVSARFLGISSGSGESTSLRLLPSFPRPAIVYTRTGTVGILENAPFKIQKELFQSGELGGKTTLSPASVLLGKGEEEAVIAKGGITTEVPSNYYTQLPTKLFGFNTPLKYNIPINKRALVNAADVRAGKYSGSILNVADVNSPLTDLSSIYKSEVSIAPIALSRLSSTQTSGISKKTISTPSYTSSTVSTSITSISKMRSPSKAIQYSNPFTSTSKSTITHTPPYTPPYIPPSSPLYKPPSSPPYTPTSPPKYTPPYTPPYIPPYTPPYTPPSNPKPFDILGKLGRPSPVKPIFGKYTPNIRGLYGEKIEKAPKSFFTGSEVRGVSPELGKLLGFKMPKAMTGTRRKRR